MVKAVITGDIVKSRRLTPENKTLLIDYISDAFKQWDEDFGTRSELFRGDSFQCLIKEAYSALRQAIIIKTYIRSFNPSDKIEMNNKTRLTRPKIYLFPHWLFDVKIAIGIGTVDYETKYNATSDGEAFQISGMLLDEIKNNRQSFAIRTKDKYNDELETEMVLLDTILGKTTALQCEVIYFKLLGYTESEISEMISVNQSAVNQRSNAAGWNAIDKAVKRFERIYGK